MANRYNFASTAGTIGDALHDMMAERESQRLKQAAEARQAEELRLQQEQDKRAAALAVDNAKTSALNRQVAEENLTRGQRTDVQKRLAETGMGGEVSGDLLTQAQKLTPESLKVTQSHEQNTLPAFTVSPQTGERTQFSQETPFTVADKTTYAGTHEERSNHELAGKIGSAKSRQEAVQIAIDAGKTPAEATTLVNTLMKQQETPMRWDPKDGTLEIMTPSGEWMKHKGPLPENYKILNEKDPNAMGGGLSTKLFQDATGTYLAKTDATGNTVMERVGGLRPFAGQAAATTTGTAAVVLGNNIAGMVDPEWVGPLKGRYNSMVSAYTDTMGPQGYRFFEAQVNNYKNQAIKAITGAQMSEPEAVRIMKALPDVNLPPETFAARLAAFNSQLETATQIAQMYSEGRKDEAFDLRMRTYGTKIDPSAAQVNEEFLQKTFPNIKVKMEDVKGATTVAGTPEGKGGAAKKGTSKYQVTVQ